MLSRCISKLLNLIKCLVILIFSPNKNQCHGTPDIIEELVEFHDHAIITALAICSLVLYLLALILTEKLSPNTVDAQEIELV